jgi:TonB-linked SusC/RagA family outer membrane protein
VSSINREGAAGGRFSDLNVIRYYRLFDYTRPEVAADGSVSYPLLAQSRYPNDQTQEQPLVATADTYDGYDRELYYELSLNYARRFGDHDLGGLVLFNRRSLINQGNSVGLGIGRFGEDYVGRVTYGFKSRYLAEFNGSYTGSSIFAPGKRYGFFPSAAVGWIISDEPFLKNLIGNNVVNLLKVRYNWGIVGSDRNVPANQFIQSYSSGGSVRFGDENFNTFGPLYAEGITANPNNTWETGTKQNLGIELNLISKIRATIDLFNESRTDILLQRLTIPRVFGNTPPFANIGEVKNHGIELDLGWNDKIGKDFKYNINATYAWSENRIVFRDDARSEADYLKDAGKSIGFATRHLQNGYYNSLDDIYNYATPNIGTPQSGIIPGDFLYSDYNADGVIDQFDRVPMRYTNVPLQVATLTLGFNYKNFGFNMMFYGAFNVYKELPDIFLWDFNNGFINGQPNITGRWTADNPMAAQKPTLHASAHRHNQNTASTYTYVNSTYARLKNAEISYRLSKESLKRVGLNSVQLYVNGNNLFTITDLDQRIDPETSGDNVYPVVRRFNIGLRANF